MMSVLSVLGLIVTGAVIFAAGLGIIWGLKSFFWTSLVSIGLIMISEEPNASWIFQLVSIGVSPIVAFWMWLDAVRRRARVKKWLAEDESLEVAVNG